MPNVLPNATSMSDFLSNTHDHLMDTADELTVTFNEIEASTNIDVVKQQYEIYNNFFYNVTNVWINNVTYSTTLKMVFSTHNLIDNVRTILYNKIE